MHTELQVKPLQFGHTARPQSPLALESRELAATRHSPADGLRQVRRSLLRRLVRRGVQRDDAEDVIQDAFLRLCLAEREQRIHNPAAFVTTVVRKVRIDDWRRAQRRERRFAAFAGDLEVIDPAPQPSDYVQADQRLERMWQRVGDLSPRTRDVFFAHRIEGRTYAQIAAALRISISAVEKHIARAAFALAEEEHSE
jgi:RNA polymerase sigma factor (sigma-70 family)